MRFQNYELFLAWRSASNCCLANPSGLLSIVKPRVNPCLQGLKIETLRCTYLSTSGIQTQSSSIDILKSYFLVTGDARQKYFYFSAKIYETMALS